MADTQPKKPIVKYRVELEKRLEINKSYKERRNRAIALRILSYGLFGQKRFQNLYLSCSLNCFYWALQIASFLHRRVAGLAMIIKFDQVHVIEYYESGYAEKKYTKILIKLTKNPTAEDKAEPGYNPGFKSQDIKDELTDVLGRKRDEARKGDRPRRARRGDQRRDRDRGDREGRRDRGERADREDRRDRGERGDREERRQRRDRDQRGGYDRNRGQERKPAGRRERDEQREYRPPREERQRYGDDRDQRRVYKEDGQKGERRDRYERGAVKTRGGNSGYQNRGQRGDRNQKVEQKERRYEPKREERPERGERRDREERGQRKPPRQTRYSEDSD